MSRSIFVLNEALRQLEADPKWVWDEIARRRGPDAVLRTQRDYLDKKIDEFEVINRFRWRDTPQGHAYWKVIAHALADTVRRIEDDKKVN